MKQFIPDNQEKIELTGVASILHPVVFKEGNMYCCLLGPDPQTGVMGCGDTAELAVSDWDVRLKERLTNAGNGDEIVQHVRNLVTPPLSDLHLKYGLRPVDKSKRRG